MLFLVGALYWHLVSLSTAVVEPWDAPGYWTAWYPLSLVLVGVAGFFGGRDGWLAGAIVTFSQLPIMWATKIIDPSSIIGVLFLYGLAVPATAISALTALVLRRR